MPSDKNDWGSFFEQVQDMDEGSPDMVNAPPHYVIKPGLEWIDIREALAQKIMREGIVLPYEDYSDWDRAQEYIVRGPWKNGIEDYKKGRYYLNRLIDRMEKRGHYAT